MEWLSNVKEGLRSNSAWPSFNPWTSGRTVRTSREKQPYGKRIEDPLQVLSFPVSKRMQVSKEAEKVYVAAKATVLPSESSVLKIRCPEKNWKVTFTFVPRSTLIGSQGTATGSFHRSFSWQAKKCPRPRQRWVLFAERTGLIVLRIKRSNLASLADKKVYTRARKGPQRFLPRAA